MDRQKGLFVTFEGGEGAGKSTLIQEVTLELSRMGHSLVHTREPGGTELGEQIRVLLLSHRKDKIFSPLAELALFLASRAQHVDEVILPALEKGKIVLCDRFSDSSIAYQGYARGLGMDKVEELCLFMSRNLQPDLTFYLDLSPTEGMHRRVEQGKKTATEKDRIENESITFHERVREGFQLLSEKHPNRLHLIDATLSQDQVLMAAMEHLKKMLSKMDKKK